MSIRKWLGCGYNQTSYIAAIKEGLNQVVDNDLPLVRKSNMAISRSILWTCSVDILFICFFVSSWYLTNAFQITLSKKKNKQPIAKKQKTTKQQQPTKLKMSSINQSGTNVGIPRIFALSCFTHHLLLFCSRIVQKLMRQLKRKFNWFN